VRVGLIAPYSGLNLGDQAIQAACIDNLRLRVPRVEITGIYLNTWRTARLHGIATFPITGLTVDFYSNEEELFGEAPAVAPRAASPAELRESPASSGWRDTLKSIPGVRAAVLAARYVANGIRNVLREAAWLVKTWRFIGRQDLILVAGSGQIDDTWGGALGQPYVLARWSILCRLRGRPFAIASVGATATRNRSSRALFGLALRNATYVSCRDPASVAMVRELANGREPKLVYDLASTLPELVAARGGETPARRVGVSPIAFGRKGSWPAEARAVYDSYLRGLCELTTQLDRDGWEVVLFTTSGVDGRAVEDLLHLLKQSSPQLATRLPVVKTTRFAELFDTLRGCSMVVASRLHGVILSHLLEKPVLAISFDPKVDAHMQQFEQQAFCVAISDAERADLNSRFAALSAAAPAVRATVRRARESFTADVDRQYDHLLTLKQRIAINPARSGQHSTGATR
jgi:polysaccharide pyruvyl transferase WcaK-like protein